MAAVRSTGRVRAALLAAGAPDAGLIAKPQQLVAAANAVFARLKA